MKPARIDWLHRTNEKFEFRVLLVQGDSTPLDLSVYDGLDLQVKADRYQPAPDLQLTLSAGLSLESGGTNGAINAEADDVDATSDMLGLYAYDILATNSSTGASDVVLEGSITFTQGVAV